MSDFAEIIKRIKQEAKPAFVQQIRDEFGWIPYAYRRRCNFHMRARSLLFRFGQFYFQFFSFSLEKMLLLQFKICCSLENSNNWSCVTQLEYKYSIFSTPSHQIDFIVIKINHFLRGKNIQFFVSECDFMFAWIGKPLLLPREYHSISLVVVGRTAMRADTRRMVWYETVWSARLFGLSLLLNKIT